MSDQETESCSGLAFPGETSSGWERSLRFFLAPHLYHDDDDDDDDDDYGDYDYFIQIDVLVSAYLRFSNICVSELFSRIVMMTTSTETGGGLMQMPGFR